MRGGAGDTADPNARTASEHARPLAISAFGGLRVVHAGKDIRIRSRKARALLGYLLLSPGGEETRERLVGLLWSEVEEEKARASLRQVVHELREVLEEASCHALQADRLTVAIDIGSVALDVHAVLGQAELRSVHPLLLDVPRLTETLLQGLDDIDPAFRVWLLANRQALHDRLLRALEPGLRHAAGEDPPAARRRIAQAVLQLDPTHEEACRALMRSCAEEGDTAAALRTYDTLWRLLGEEYDTEPTAATQQLVAEIKLGHLEPAPPAPSVADKPPGRTEGAGAPGGPGRPADRETAGAPSRIALLVEPFAMHGVAVQAHLVQGFRHDLIACLVRFREWFVVDGPSLPPPEQTRSRISGSFRISATAYQAGERISMVLTLADQETGFFVWSERLDLRLDNWFEAQQHIVRRIAIALNMQISTARLARLATEPDVSLEAYDRWLRGQAMIRRFSPENWDRAAQLFHECIERTPTFSPAYSSLAQMENSVHIIHPGVRRERAREARSLDYARRAVELDATDSRAQLCLGWSLIMAGRYPQALIQTRLALDLNPSDSWTLISAALIHSFCGEHDLARDLAAQSLEMTLVPSLTHWGYQVTIAYLAGDDTAALDACDRAEDVIRTLPAWRAAALANLGRAADAVAFAANFLVGIRANWFAAEPPTDQAVLRWLLHLYPIRRAEDWERLRDGLATAGLPTAGTAHGDW